MRKLAEQLVVGRVYADTQEDYDGSTTYLEFVGRTEEGFAKMKYVGGYDAYEMAIGDVTWWEEGDYYELNQEYSQDAIYNQPNPRMISEAEILKALEVVKKEARFISDEDSNYDKHWKMFRDKAIDIIHRELKLNKQ